MLVVVAVDGVLDDSCIAEAQLVVFLDEGLLGLFIALVGEFLRFEEVGEFAGLMDLAEGTLADE